MFQKLAHVFSPNPLTEKADSMYIACVTQARNPFFYTELRVPDSLDGRFDMIVLHLFLLLRALKADIALGEAITDAFFTDMDRNLREMGVGDPSVGKRIRKMLDALYGRIHAYESSWQDDAALKAAVIRNIYAGTDVESAPQLLMNYMRACATYFQETAASLREGNVVWASPTGR